MHGSEGTPAGRPPSSHMVCTGRGRHAAVVVADAGDEAWVVMVLGDSPLAVGSRFDFQGESWEITHDRGTGRGFIAIPSAQLAGARH
jgi:urease beta subunit